MEIVSRWCRRIAGPLVIMATGILATPTAASAHTDPSADTLAAGGKAVAGGVGVLCCLIVVGAVVGTTIMIIRRRRR